MGDVVERFLASGDLRQGFARIRCEDCGDDYLLPYSCKCRGFCPSCVQRRALEFEEFLEDGILRPEASHRHWTWTGEEVCGLRFATDNFPTVRQFRALVVGRPQTANLKPQTYH